MIAKIVYNTNLNNLIDKAVEQAKRSEHVLLTDAYTILDAVEHYLSCPCKVDLRFVYQKHIKPLEADLDYYPQIIEYRLKQIEAKCSEPVCTKPQENDEDKEESFEVLVAKYEDESRREAKARLDYHIFRSRYKFMEGITPEVIDMFMNKVTEICNGIIAELADKGIAWKDPRNHD